VSSITDLESISSFGFRGEALPSIAAVAEVEAVTCAAGESVGESLRLSNGNVVGEGREARVPGTTITVRNLFHAVPARLKFLKSAATENGHIARVVSEYALAFPEVRFSLTIDDRAVLKTPGNGLPLDSVVAVYGLGVARHMKEIVAPERAWQDSDGPAAVTVAGMIGTPQVSRANRDYLSFFVNRRSINSRLLSWAVEEAYHGLLMQGRHPIAIVNIALPLSEVDVNIHPTKAEVKFRNERAVFAAVQRAVRGTLVDLAPGGMVEEAVATYTAPMAGFAPRPATGAHTAPRVGPSPPRPALGPAPLVRLPALRVLGQAAASYIVAEGPDGLYVVDQHAAHERIFYEKYRRQQAGRRIEVQGLLEPVPFEVTPQQDEVLKAARHRLEEHGFGIEPFGERTYLVRAIPALLDSRAWPDMVRELLDAVASGGEAADWTEAAAISLACHTAVRAGKTLSDQEMRQLVRDLEETEMPRTCPHGRPTVLQIGSRQLEREFGRG
jgi:DNA mismatch repair protein MutL